MIFSCPRTGQTIDFSGVHPSTAEMISQSLSNSYCKADTVLIIADLLDSLYADADNQAWRHAHYRRVANKLRDIAPAYAKELPRVDPLG